MIYLKMRVIMQIKSQNYIYVRLGVLSASRYLSLFFGNNVLIMMYHKTLQLCKLSFKNYIQVRLGQVRLERIKCKLILKFVFGNNVLIMMYHKMLQLCKLSFKITFSFSTKRDEGNRSSTTMTMTSTIFFTSH